MSWPATHALLNHFPIVLVIVGALILLVALLRPMRGAWLYALGSFVLAGLSVYPAWITGEQAGRFVREAWYIAPGAVHRHAETADITLWVLLALGLASLIAWLSIARTTNAISPAGWLRTVVALLAIVALGCICVTAYLGGKIVIESPILMRPLPPIAVPIDSTPGARSSPGQLAAPGSPTPPGGAIVPVPAQPAQPAPTQQQMQTQPQTRPQPQPGTVAPSATPAGTTGAPAARTTP